MNKFLAIMCLCLPALGQVTYSGQWTGTGSVSSSAVQGVPLTYGARTDLCVTGLETGCSGLGLSFQMRMAAYGGQNDVPPFANYPNAPMGTAAADPDFHSYLVMLTDWTVHNRTNMWQINNGDQATFNQNSTMLYVVQNGNVPRLLLLNPTAIHAHQSGTCAGCVAVTSIVAGTVQSNCGTSCTNLDIQGAEVWSLVPGETNVMYELAADNVTVNRLVIQPDCTMSTPLSCTFSRTPYIQFTSDTYGKCSVWGSQSQYYVTGGWNAVVNVAYDGSFSYGTGGAPDWQPSTAYTYPDSFIFPQTNNGSNPVNAFQATVSGTSGGSGNEPNWASSCGTAGQTCSDNTVTWTNIGKVTGQGNGFDVLNFNPSRGCSRVNTFNSKVYRGTNEGANWPNAGSADPSGSWTTDDNFVCEAYGVSYPGTCPLTDDFTLHEGGSVYDSRYVTFTPNGANTAAGCQVPGNCSCITGSVNYRHAYSSSNTYSTGDAVYDPNHGAPYSLYTAITSVPANPADEPPNATYWKAGDVACYHYVWQTQSTIMRPCMARGAALGGQCDGHEVTGYIYEYKGTAQGGLVPHLWSRPSISGAANPGVPTTVPSQGLPAQHHGTHLNTGTTDLTPLGIVQTGVPTANYALEGNPPGSPPANLPWYAEFILVAVDGSNTVYRTNHNFNTGSNATFNSQNNVGAISEDGQFAAITTDMMGTRGSYSPDWQASHAYTLGTTMFPTAGNAGNYDFQILTAPTGNSGGIEPSSWCQTAGCTTTDGGVTWTNLGASCNQLRGMFSPATNTAFSLNDMVFPTTSNAGSNIYQATQAGTTYSSLPNWGSKAPNWGDTVCEDAGHEQNVSCANGVVQWTNVGPNDCRNDVMLVDLLSAH